MSGWASAAKLALARVLPAFPPESTRQLPCAPLLARRRGRCRLVPSKGPPRALCRLAAGRQARCGAAGPQQKCHPVSCPAIAAICAVHPCLSSPVAAAPPLTSTAPSAAAAVCTLAAPTWSLIPPICVHPGLPATHLVAPKQSLVQPLPSSLPLACPSAPPLHRHTHHQFDASLPGHAEPSTSCARLAPPAAPPAPPITSDCLACRRPALSSAVCLVFSACCLFFPTDASGHPPPGWPPACALPPFPRAPPLGSAAH